MRKIIIWIFIFTFLVGGLFFYNNYLYSKKFIERLKSESDHLAYVFRGEILNFSDEFPKKKEDIDYIYKRYKMFESEKDLLFFENGYGVWYDSINNKSIIYSYGPDGKDDSLKKIPFNTKDSLGNIIDISFNIESFINSNKSDIVIFELYNNDHYYNLCKFKTVEDLRKKSGSGMNSPYVVSKKLSFIGEDDKMKFIKEVEEFELDLNKSINRKDNDKIVFFRLKNNKISIVCENGFSRKTLKKTAIKVQEFFSSINKNYFDYAVFPIVIK